MDRLSELRAKEHAAGVNSFSIAVGVLIVLILTVAIATQQPAPPDPAVEAAIAALNGGAYTPSSQTARAASFGQTFRGSGPGASSVFTLSEGLLLIRYSLAASGYNGIELMDGVGNQIDLVLNDSGAPARGSKAVRVDRPGLYLFNVRTEGAWVVEIGGEPGAAPPFASSYSPPPAQPVYSAPDEYSYETCEEEGSTQSKKAEIYDPPAEPRRIAGYRWDNYVWVLGTPESQVDLTEFIPAGGRKFTATNRLLRLGGPTYAADVTLGFSEVNHLLEIVLDVDAVDFSFERALNYFSSRYTGCTLTRNGDSSCTWTSPDDDRLVVSVEEGKEGQAVTRIRYLSSSYHETTIQFVAAVEVPPAQDDATAVENTPGGGWEE